MVNSRNTLLFEHVDMWVLDRVCDRKYEKTFQEVVEYLSEAYRLEAGPKEAIDSLPDEKLYKYAPDGSEVELIVTKMLPAGLEHVKGWRDSLKDHVESNIFFEIQSAILDATTQMKSDHRFSGKQEAVFNVTQDAVELVQLRPLYH